MGLISWIILGALAGWIASAVMKDKTGLIMDVILGVVGALIGGFAMSLLGQPGVTGLNLYSIVLAVAGALVLIWAGRRVSYK